MARFIDTLRLPEDLRSASVSDLRVITKELREELIEKVCNSGGHFASSLGAAELTVVLHHLFATPRDRLVWDVGHQAYIHKMVTGRRELMGSIRTAGGISGYLRRDESEYDAFGAGHAGTSISAGLGMRLALTGDEYVVVIIGDGSLTCGMAFEALNHAGELYEQGKLNGRFIVVLNDNDMSISPNVGGLSWLFSRVVTSHLSTRARTRVKNLKERGYVPHVVYEAIDRAEEAAQGFLHGAARLFESFGFRYIGPVDGHNIEDLIAALSRAKEQQAPVLVHASTQKGKGHSLAEVDPLTWHAVSPPRSPGKAGAPPQPLPTYSQVFGETLATLASQDDRIVGITAAMAGGTGLDILAERVPKAFIDVGICEQHAVTLAAGLACEGKRPVCSIYSTFLQRAYDQVIHDVAIQKLPVVLVVDRAGVVGNDGETHQGVFDISFLRPLPNLIAMAPADEAELRDMLVTALSYHGPSCIRFPRGTGVGLSLDSPPKPLPVGKGVLVATPDPELLERGGIPIALICLGPLVQYGLRAAAMASRRGLAVTVVNPRWIKPLDGELLAELAASNVGIVIAEDHSLSGGFGSAVLEWYADAGLRPRVRRLGVGDFFVPHATQAEQHEMCGYTPEAMVAALEAMAMAGANVEPSSASPPPTSVSAAL